MAVIDFEYFDAPECVAEMKWALEASAVVFTPVVAVENKKQVGTFIAVAKEKAGLSIGHIDFISVDLSSELRMAASVDEFVQKAGLLAS